MNEQASLANITFTENGQVDVAQLNALYRFIGWDSHNRRTVAETTEEWQVFLADIQACIDTFAPAACLCHPSVRLMPAEAGREL